MNKAVLIFPFIIISLLLATWTGWIRIGWNLPVSSAAAQHGALMVNSFLASVIFLERAVTFKNKWILLLPLINALSVVAILSGNVQVAQLINITASLGFLIMCIYFIIVHKEFYYYIFLAGALCLLVGNALLYLRNFYPIAVPWWMGFLLFTIVAERLELSRFLPQQKLKENLLVASLVIVFISLLWPFHANGNIALGISLALVALWLLKFDMAFHSIKIKGQHRYSGLLLITGYAWLLVTAALLAFESWFSFGYDAALHSFFIGFVFSMIFSHAPIILPAVAKLPIKLYRPVLYVWFILLQLSLLARIIADLMEHVPIRRIAGLVNGIVILLFFVTVVTIVKLELAKRKRLKKA